MLCAPIRRDGAGAVSGDAPGDGLLGVLQWRNRHNGVFTRSEERVAKQFAVTASIAMQLAQTDAQRKVVEERMEVATTKRDALLKSAKLMATTREMDKLFLSIMANVSELPAPSAGRPPPPPPESPPPPPPQPSPEPGQGAARGRPLDALPRRRRAPAALVQGGRRARPAGRDPHPVGQGARRGVLRHQRHDQHPRRVCAALGPRPSFSRRAAAPAERPLLPRSGPASGQTRTRASTRRSTGRPATAPGQCSSTRSATSATSRSASSS